jgi:hypothetical protein
MHDLCSIYGFTCGSGLKDLVAETIDAQREQRSAIIVVVHDEYFLFHLGHNMRSRIGDAN